MFWHWLLAGLAVLSVLLLLWQWWVAKRFPLHLGINMPSGSPGPGVTLLKPLKGADSATAECLRSWFRQSYPGPVEILFAVASAEDPVVPLVQGLLEEFPSADARLIICGPPDGANAKVSKLAQLEYQAKYDMLVVSDADVFAPPGCIAELAGLLSNPSVGLANCFYSFAHPATPAMRWETAAVNMDFWSQVLQSCSLKPMDFALGAVMATRKRNLSEIGGFAGLKQCLADDYQLGHRIAAHGHRIALASTVVTCHSAIVGWSPVWKHQVRWARTIRVCQPVPYFFSILSNPTFWPLAWVLAHPVPTVLGFAMGAWLLRMILAADLDRRLNHNPTVPPGWILLKDILQVGVWLAAFAGNTVEWRGETYKLASDGTLQR